MTLSPRTQAVLLLTTRLVRPSPADPKPLSAAEWARFASWLRAQNLSPEMLLENDSASVVSGFEDEKVTVDRLRYLIAQGGALAIAAEKWERAGIWTIIRGDADYPKRLRGRLGKMSPPILFGSGNRLSLNCRGIAIVGSRVASTEDLAFASTLGARAASESIAVVSGGARGVDEAAMFGALESGGASIGVLADSLLKAAVSRKYRDFLTNGSATLISSFNPEAAFSVGTAMARNRYVYCLAEAAVVVAVTEGTGGTWAGATEILRHGSVPVWVRTATTLSAGADALVALGARPLGEVELISSIAALLSTPLPAAVEVRSSGQGAHPALEVRDNEEGVTYSPQAAALSKSDESVRHSVSSYEEFLEILRDRTLAAPATAEEIYANLEVSKTRVRGWLTQAVEERRVSKVLRPLRYQWSAARQQTLL